MFQYSSIRIQKYPIRNQYFNIRKQKTSIPFQFFYILSQKTTIRFQYSCNRIQKVSIQFQKSPILSQKVRRIIKNDFDKVFGQVDVILAPATTGTAFKLDEPKTPVELYLEDVFTIPANLAGIPGLVVPAGKVEGLPVGIQLLGKAFDEKTLLKAGKAFETSVGKMEMPKRQD